MDGLGICINVDSYVTHMFYALSFSHNTAVPIAIKKKIFSFVEYTHYCIFLGRWKFQKNIFINMKKLKSK